MPITVEEYSNLIISLTIRATQAETKVKELEAKIGQLDKERFAAKGATKNAE